VCRPPVHGFAAMPQDIFDNIAGHHILLARRYYRLSKR
jgi:hypothetical protein